jgi:hypothetical protein
MSEQEIISSMESQHDLDKRSQGLGYKGKIYNITSLHKKYLTSLARVSGGDWVSGRDWLNQCASDGVKTNDGSTPKTLSNWMILGVFAVRNYLDIDDSNDLLRYRITEEGLRFLNLSLPATLAQVEENLENYGTFNINNIEDVRERIKSNIVLRRGQPAFRKTLLQVYECKCAITKCNVTDVLEAAHIYPYKGEETNHIGNGLLLRTDMHTLFDLGLIAIDPENFTVLLSRKLHETEYKRYKGKRLYLPKIQSHWPDKEALAWHRRDAGL